MPDPTPDRTSARALGLALTATIAVAAVALLRAGPPPLVPADAPAQQASGARAAEVLARLVGDGAPRPVGAAAHAALPARLVGELERLGLEVDVQDTFARRVERGVTVCGRVRNVVARRRGAVGYGASAELAAGGDSAPLRALLCMAHYDSVGAGPGVADDLAGVAAWLEVARALRARGAPLARDLVFLFSDAEEPGLLGAEAFASQHPWAADVGAVINLEARGTGGASRMFETGADNDWIAAAFARGATRPSATSLSTEVYRRMPNDTDYSVFRERGIAGLNFAWIGGVARYHTPLDDLAHLDPRALQHHVTNAFDAVLALDRAPWREPGAGRGDAAFADVLGVTVVLLREDTARALALGALLVLLAGAARAVRRGATTSGRVAGGALLGLLVAAATVKACGLATDLDQAVAGVARPWRARPGPAVVGVLGAALTVAALAGTFGRRSVGVVGLALGGAVVAALGTLLAALFVPGAGLLLLAPALAAALAAALARWRPGAGAGALAVLPAPLAALTLAPLGAALLEAFGLAPPSVPGPSLGAALGALAGLWLLFGLPALAAASDATRLALGALGAVAVLFGAVLCRLLPATSPAAPGHLAIVYAADDEGGVAEWLLATSGDPVPAALLERGTFREPRVPPRWSSRPAVAAPAPYGLAAFPALEDVAALVPPGGDSAIVTATLRPGAGGHVVDLTTTGVASLLVEGLELAGPRARLVGLGPGGVRLTLTLEPDAPRPALEVVERSLGLLPEAAHLAAARGEARVPAHLGDGAQLRRRFVLGELLGGGAR